VLRESQAKAARGADDEDIGHILMREGFRREMGNNGDYMGFWLLSVKREKGDDGLYCSQCTERE
jgi:hypothetical protein